MRLMSRPPADHSGYACWMLQVIFEDGDAIKKFCKHRDAAFVVEFLIDFLPPWSFEADLAPCAMFALLLLIESDEGKQLLLLPGNTHQQ